MHFIVHGKRICGSITSLHETALRYIWLFVFCMIIDLCVPGVFIALFNREVFHAVFKRDSRYGEVFHAVFNSCYIVIESVFRSHSFTLLS